jgi:hypothetical protein
VIERWVTDESFCPASFCLVRIHEPEPLPLGLVLSELWEMSQ